MSQLFTCFGQTAGINYLHFSLTKIPVPEMCLIPQLLVLLTLLASGPIFKVDALLAAPRHAQEVTDYASHFNHGGELIQQMRFHDAVAEFREALRLKPDYLPAHQVLANTRSRCPSTGRLTRIFEYPAICWPDSAPAITCATLWSFRRSTRAHKRVMEG